MMTTLVLVAVLCRHDCLAVIGGVPCLAAVCGHVRIHNLHMVCVCTDAPCHNTVHLQLRAWCTTHAYAATQHNASGALHL